MKNKKKMICFLAILLIISVFAFSSDMFITDDVESVIIDDPRNDFLIAAAPAVDATSATANNVTGLTTDDILATYQYYTFVANVSDADGDIVNVTIDFVIAGTSYASILYVNATGVFSENSGASDIRLGAGTSNITTGTVIDLTIPFMFEWTMGAVTDLDVNVTVNDASVATEATSNINIDSVATLALSDATLFTYGTYSKNELYGTSSLTYHYTGLTTTYPKANETDFWVTRAAVPAEQLSERSWESGSYTEGTGVAVWTTLAAGDTSGGHTETFTLFAVTQSGGSSGTTIMGTTNTDTVIIQKTPIVTDRETRDQGIITPIFDSQEGALLIAGVAIVFFAGAYMMYGRNTAPVSRRRKPAKRKATKRKTKKRKRKR